MFDSSVARPVAGRLIVIAMTSPAARGLPPHFYKCDGNAAAVVSRQFRAVLVGREY